LPGERCVDFRRPAMRDRMPDDRKLQRLSQLRPAALRGTERAR
jgi:hypothetical protein